MELFPGCQKQVINVIDVAERIQRFLVEFGGFKQKDTPAGMTHYRFSDFQLLQTGVGDDPIIRAGTGGKEGQIHVVSFCLGNRVRSGQTHVLRIINAADQNRRQLIAGGDLQ